MITSSSASGSTSGAASNGALTRLLSHRFGDGLVYLSSAAERVVLERAVALGLVSDDGYLTPAGMTWLAGHGEG